MRRERRGFLEASLGKSGAIAAISFFHNELYKHCQWFYNRKVHRDRQRTIRFFSAKAGSDCGIFFFTTNLTKRTNSILGWNRFILHSVCCSWPMLLGKLYCAAFLMAWCPSWSKGVVCKTIIRRFESDPRLFEIMNYELWIMNLSFTIYNSIFGPGGGIGRHKGLKIPRPLKPCRFDSGPGYYLNMLIILLLQLSHMTNIVVSL